jgi:hypothetical protein
MTRYEEGRRAGRRGARESHQPELDARFFLAPGTADTFSEWDGTNGITSWGMDCNGPDPNNPPAYPDGLGDCGAAAPDHGNMAKAANPSLLGTLGQPKFGGTVPTYFAYGVSQGETGTPPAPADEPDQGVDNKSWLAFLYKNGIIDGYAEVPLDQIGHYAPIGHGLLVGQNLPDSAESDFQASPPIPWGSPGETPDNQEGHDTWLIATHADASGEMITWGGLEPFTSTYLNDFATDAWIIFDKDDPTVDWTALQAALDALHGVVTPPAPAPAPTPTPPAPAPPTPTPPAPPVPDNPPAPKPPQPPPEFRQWLADIKAWAGDIDAWLTDTFG